MCLYLSQRKAIILNQIHNQNYYPPSLGSLFFTSSDLGVLLCLCNLTLTYLQSHHRGNAVYEVCSNEIFYLTLYSLNNLVVSFVSFSNTHGTHCTSVRNSRLLTQDGYRISILKKMIFKKVSLTHYLFYKGSRK